MSRFPFSDLQAGDLLCLKHTDGDDWRLVLKNTNNILCWCYIRPIGHNMVIESKITHVDMMTREYWEIFRDGKQIF